MTPTQSQSTSKNRLLETKKNIQQIVEAMLEENITKEWFLENSKILCQADYDDVVQERSIDHLCGYPMCSKPIKMILKQQYRISANKVYDITERKNFCSNECYKASNYFKVQLDSLPFYMRKQNENSKSFKLLSDSNNKGSAGEELIFKERITEKEIETSETIETVVSTNLTSMLQEDLKSCTEQLNDLKIQEKVYKEKYVFGENQEENVPEDEEDNIESTDSETIDTDDKALFPEYDNLKVLSNKHMPFHDNRKKAVLIDPLKMTKTINCVPTKLSIESISKIFLDWFTEDTLKYLLGEKQVYSIKADHLFKTIVKSDSSPEKLEQTKMEYVNMCIKIDKLTDNEIDNSHEMDFNKTPVTKEVDGTTQELMVKLADDIEKTSATVKKNPMRKKNKDSLKNKSVTFAPDVKPKKNKSKSSDDLDSETQPELNLPLVDSMSQNTLRKQVLIGKLRSLYIDVLSVIDLQYRDVKDEVKAIVDTFSLTPSNIVFKSKEMKCIVVVLYRILTNTKLKELQDDYQFVKLCENFLKNFNITYEEIDNLVSDLLSPSLVISLYKNYL